MTVLLYDGDCGVCGRVVHFVLRHEGAARSLRFAPLDGPTGRALRARRALGDVDSFIWYETAGDVVHIRSDAVLRVVAYLGGGWGMLGWVARLAPRPLRDWVYDVVARHRHLMGGTACLVPTAAQRGRFLDVD